MVRDKAGQVGRLVYDSALLESNQLADVLDQVNSRFEWLPQKLIQFNSQLMWVPKKWFKSTRDSSE